MRIRWFFLAIVVGMPSLTLLWWWWTDGRLRSLRGAGVRRLGRAAVAGFAVAFLGGFATYMLTRMHGGSLSLPPWWMAGLMLWGLIVLPTMVLPLLAGAGLWRVVRKAVALSRGRDTAAGEAAGEGMTRREVLGAAVALAPMVLTLGATAVSIPQKRRFRIRRILVDLPQLPRGLDGMSIAHVSDTHVGKFTRGDILARIAAATESLDADLVLFTGDLIDYSLADLPAALTMVDQMRRDERFFLIEGNHDLFEGREAFEQAVRRAGVPLLLDESATVRVRGRPVQVMGLQWHGRHGEGISDHVDRVAAQRDPDAFPVLLAHHPHAFDRAAQHDIALTLAGHTHGGQLMLTPEVGVGPMLFRYWSGLYRQGEARLVVSNGVGNWFPLRTYAPAEIVHLTLRRS